MPFNGTYPNYGPMSPATQASVIDSSSTFTGTAALGLVPGNAVLLAAGDSVSLAPLSLAGQSTVVLTGTSGISMQNTQIQVFVTVNGTPTQVSMFFWRNGEQAIYETYRLTGESVYAIFTATPGFVATDPPTDFYAQLHVISV